VPARPQRTIIQQFQPGYGWEKSGTGTVSEDTVDFARRTQSLKIVTANDEISCKVFKKSISPAIDMTGKSLVVVFKTEQLAKIKEFEVFLSSDNLSTNNVHYTISTPAQPFAAEGEWASITISWGDFANNAPPGSINRAAINYIEIRVKDRNEGAATVRVNEISTVAEPPSGLVSLVFDDGWESHYTRARAVLDKYGYRGSCCVIRDRIGTSPYMSLTQLTALQNVAGWEICAHADTVANHNTGFANLSDAVAEEEMQKIKRWLIENGFRWRDLFIWPKGSFTASQQVIARKYFNAIRGTTGGRGGSNGSHEVFPPADPRHLRAWLVPRTATAANVESALTQCSTYKSHLILTWHDIVASGATEETQINLSVFEEMIAKVAASGLAVKPLGEALEG
jgi:hypothetical protein